MSDLQFQVEEMDPGATYQALANGGSAAMVDVRTRAEWAFVGLPDISATGKPLWTIEWVSFPAMTQNPHFTDQLLDQAGGSLPESVFFICRSGARSLSAAHLVGAVARSAGQAVRCVNVAEGFEGDLDATRHRSSVNGWKARGLPWGQS